jgi:hypothetical protein
MRRAMIAVLVVSTFAATTACKKGGDKSGGPGGSGSGSGSTAAAAAEAAGAGDLASFLKDENAPLTPAIEEQLLLGLKDCAVTDAGIDPKCEGLKTWTAARGRKTAAKQLLGGTTNLGAKYIGHESPAIRFKAADLMSSLFGADASTQKTMVEAANKEKVPGVLANMIQAVGSKHKGNADVKALLMTGADHPSERVRTESMGWFLTSFGQGVPGTFEKVMTAMDKDPSVKVRSTLCGRLYGSSDDRAIPILEKYLVTDKTTPDDLYRGCWDGAIAAWTGYAKPEKPNQKAFELTCKVLEAAPRTKERPPWTGISTLKSAKTDLKPDDKFGQEWLAKVKPWYKQDRLLKGLEGVVSDSNANWLGRNSGLEAMKDLGAPKATFERVQKKYAAATSGDDAQVKRKVEEILKTM